MFDSKKCISITWNKNKHVFGISLKRNAKNNHIALHAFCNNEEYSFAERLKDVYNKLYINQDQSIVIGGYIPSAVCFELKLPPLSSKDTVQYLYYELARQIPYPVHKLKWWFRYLTAKENETEQHVRVFAIFEEEWNELLGEITLSEIKIDSFVYPFMALNPFFQDTGISFTGIDEEFFFCPASNSEDAFMKKMPSSPSCQKNILEGNDVILKFFKEKYEGLNIETPENFIPSLLLAEYCLSPNYLRDKKLNIPTPSELQPKRYKSQKIISIVLFIILIILSSSYIIRQKIDTMETINALTDEKVLLLATIKKINVEYRKNQKYETIINEIEESTPKAIEPIKYLQALTKAVSANIWMTSFASNKDKINITLQTKSDAGNVISELNKSRLFRTENVRKRKTSSGNQYIYLTLKPRLISNQ